MNLHPELWAQGCAMCRAALESSPEGKTIAAGLARGILLMLALPYGLMEPSASSSIARTARNQKSVSRIRIPIRPSPAANAFRIHDPFITVDNFAPA